MKAETWQIVKIVSSVAGEKQGLTYAPEEFFLIPTTGAIFALSHKDGLD